MSIFHLPSEMRTCGVLPLPFAPSTLKSINRELRFVARTLGRLRHKHHLSHLLSQCSPDPLTPSNELDPLSFVLHRVLGRQSKPEPIEDIESAPASPSTSVRSSLCQSDDDDSEWQWPAPIQTTWPVQHPKQTAPPQWQQPLALPRYQTPRQQTPLPTDENFVHVTVDSRMPTTFFIPSSTLSTPTSSPPTSPISPLSAASADSFSSSPPSSPTAIFLPDTPAAQFHDFARWLRISQILPYVPRGEDAPQWAVEDAARRLRDAFRLGVELGCDAYQKAAVREFRELGEEGRRGLGW